MTAAQIVQSMGFFWLAATGLLLSVEMRHWDYPDFVGPVCGVAIYLIGRNCSKLEAPLEPWKLMMAISAVAPSYTPICLPSSFNTRSRQ